MPFFPYKNTKVHYTSTGKGSVVVLLHGFLESVAMWKDIIPELSKNHRVIAVDLLGHGKTGNLGYVHTMEVQAEMAKELLSSLRLRKITFIAHSMGGYVALSFADLFPDSVCIRSQNYYQLGQRIEIISGIEKSINGKKQMKI